MELKYISKPFSAFPNNGLLAIFLYLNMFLITLFAFCTLCFKAIEHKNSIYIGCNQSFCSTKTVLVSFQISLDLKSFLLFFQFTFWNKPKNNFFSFVTLIFLLSLYHNFFFQKSPFRFKINFSVKRAFFLNNLPL